MSRVAKSLKNAKVGVIFFTLSLLTQFFSRSIFLNYLGEEFIGLSSTLRNILGFLNLAELGIGTAVGFSLYKPIFDKNHVEINKIIALMGYLYKNIGLGIIILSAITSLFFPFFFDELTLPLELIYFVFFVVVSSAMFSYFFNYHMVLLQADQKNYIVQGYLQSSYILRVLLQCAVAYYFQSFYVWIALELVFSVIYSIILRKKVKEQYPWLNISYTQSRAILKEYPEITKKIKQVFFHKLSAFVKDGTDNILIFALVSVQSVAFFGNYQLIFSKLTALIKVAFVGTEAGIGNLIAEDNKDNIRKVFWEMLSLYFFIGGFLSLLLFNLMDPLISLWVGTKYILDRDILIIMTVIFFLSQIRKPIDLFKNAYGLYADTWAPAVQIVINLGFSYFCGRIWGIAGIMFGTFMSLIIIVSFWRPYYLYRHGFKKSVWEYWKGFVPLILVFGVAAVIINYFFFNTLTDPDSYNFLDFVVYAIKLAASIFVVYTSLLFIFISGFRVFCYRLKDMVIKKKKKS